MTVLPVIERELRVQARLWFTYLIRVLGALALLGACLWYGMMYGFDTKLGASLFGCLNTTMIISIWVLAPLISADCISRERREGTVGLLFMTPLKAREIVLAKGLVHGVRSLSLLLAVLPVATISFLLGGVTWREAVLSLLVNFSCICWALAAGLLASSVSKSWLRAMLLSGGLAICFFASLILLTGCAVIMAMYGDPGFHLPYPYFGGWVSRIYTHFVQAALPIGFFGMTGLEGWWGMMFGALRPKTQRVWMMHECGVALFSLLFLLLAVFVAAWNLRRIWQEEPPSARRLWIQKQFCTPIVGVAFFHRWLRRKLDRNPIGWLEQRTWSGRLVTWGWLAVMVSFYSAVTTAPNSWTMLALVQNLLAWMMMGIIASSAAGSFQRERESRVLELLLVSPMSAGKIISGRLRGLWGQFVPAFGLLSFVWLLQVNNGTLFRTDFHLVPFFFAGYLTIPVIGLYYSLSRKQFITAFLWTIWTGLMLPFVLKWLIAAVLQFVFIGLLNVPSEGPILAPVFYWIQRMMEAPLFISFVQAAIGIHFMRHLQNDLESRKFAFSTGGT